jgi:hypothetical protein
MINTVEKIYTDTIDNLFCFKVSIKVIFGNTSLYQTTSKHRLPSNSRNGLADGGTVIDNGGGE